MKGSTKKLSQIVGKWIRRGHFVVYSEDNTRFLVPLRYLNHPICRVLLEMAEEEYGLNVRGPLRIPCDKEFFAFILSMLGKNTNDNVDKALLSISRFHANYSFL
ncbi:auxin-responsive protein SAUR66-like [Salvia divinorum]|uniref:Auxin-responsive protein SAUR66-like n=1 Tax=Salvia divinorum TaxID=28513 RepID=A0ABD1FMQ2_SALDI